MFELRRFREAVGITQIEAAVRADVSPPLARAFERHGPDAVIEPAKRARLVALYDGFRRQAELEGKAA
jgi:predicted transcriptional regulator